MFGWKLIAGAVGVLAALGLVWAHFADDRRTEEQLAALTQWGGEVLHATREASDNPGLRFKETPGQIVAMGDTIADLTHSVKIQNQAIDELARERIRLKAKAAELKIIADKAQAQRRAALERLSDMATTPGTRDDCMQLLREAETALDLVAQAGL